MWFTKLMDLCSFSLYLCNQLKPGVSILGLSGPNSHLSVSYMWIFSFVSPKLIWKNITVHIFTFLNVEADVVLVKMDVDSSDTDHCQFSSLYGTVFLMLWCHSVMIAADESRPKILSRVMLDVQAICFDTPGS